MNRQQRTNYLRQTTTTVQPQALYSLTWTVVASIGAVLTLKIEGMLNGLVLNGVPALIPEISGRVPVSAVIVPGPSPDLYQFLEVTFDGALANSDLYTLEMPSPSLRNRWGGVLNSGKQAFPTPFIFSDEIAIAYAGHTPTQLQIDFFSQFLPVCIGPSPILENNATFELGTFVGWSGGWAVFDFSLGLASGNQISWPSAQASFKNQFGGTLTGGSFVIP